MEGIEDATSTSNYVHFVRYDVLVSCEEVGRVIGFCSDGVHVVLVNIAKFYL